MKFKDLKLSVIVKHEGGDVVSPHVTAESDFCSTQQIVALLLALDNFKKEILKQEIINNAYIEAQNLRAEDRKMHMHLEEVGGDNANK